MFVFVMVTVTTAHFFEITIRRSERRWHMITQPRNKRRFRNARLDAQRRFQPFQIDGFVCIDVWCHIFRFRHFRPNHMLISTAQRRAVKNGFLQCQ